MSGDQSGNLAKSVIEALGGLTNAAKVLDLPITTVHGWMRSGRIPAWRIEAIRKAAEADSEITLPKNFPTEKAA